MAAAGAPGCLGGGGAQAWARTNDDPDDEAPSSSPIASTSNEPIADQVNQTATEGAKGRLAALSF